MTSSLGRPLSVDIHDPAASSDAAIVVEDRSRQALVQHQATAVRVQHGADCVRDGLKCCCMRFRRNWLGGTPQGGQVVEPASSCGALPASPPAELLDSAANQDKQYDRQDVLGVEDPKAVVRLGPEIVVRKPVVTAPTKPAGRTPAADTMATTRTSSNVT
jgi:hypothetical protein